jgi:hypothetical protein
MSQSNSSSRSLLSEREAAARYGKTTRTLVRWDETAGLNFPPVILIRGRRYRDRAALDAWDLQNSKQAAARARPRSRRLRKAKPSPKPEAAAREAR